MRCCRLGQWTLAGLRRARPCLPSPTFPLEVQRGALKHLFSNLPAGAIGLGDYVEASGIVFLFCVAEWLEDRCVRALNPEP